jgi:hypothetical protein
MKRWLMLLACSTGFIGCQQTEHRVIDRLPDPYQAALARGLQRAPAARAAAERASPGTGWMPPQLSANWQCIVIHHTASETGSLSEIDRWHRGKGWDGCGYHFVVGNGTGSLDGLVEPSARWQSQSTGAHTRLNDDHPDSNYYNEHGIGIVLVGNFENSRATERQLESLVQLLRFLRLTCGIPESRIYVHKDLKVTDCPGRNFSKAELIRRLHASQ